MVGHTNFYAKMVLAKFGVCCKIRTPGSDPVKGGLPNGNIYCRSGPRKKKPNSTTDIDLQVGTGGNMWVSLAAEVLAVHMIIKMARKYRYLLAVSLAKARNDI